MHNRHLGRRLLRSPSGRSQFGRQSHSHLRGRRPSRRSPESRQPTSVPTRPLRPPPPPKPDRNEPPIQAGDLVCQVCGAGNSPERRFCRRCGNSLATAVVAVKPVWWRRLLGRNQRAMAAGYRPGSMGRRGQPRPSILKRVVVVVLVLVIVLPIVGYFTLPQFKQAVDGLINRAMQTFTLQQNPSGNAVDGNVATVWLADPSGAPPTLRVNFAETTDLSGMIFQIGATPGADYASYARPRQVELVFLGDPNTIRINLEDDPGPQERCLPENHQVRSLDVRILSTYPPGQGGQNLVGYARDRILIGELLDTSPLDAQFGQHPVVAVASFRRRTMVARLIACLDEQPPQRVVIALDLQARSARLGGGCRVAASKKDLGKRLARLDGADPTSLSPFRSPFSRSVLGK